MNGFAVTSVWMTTRWWIRTAPPVLWLGLGLLGLCVAALPLPLALAIGAGMVGVLLIPYPALGLCLLALAIPFGLVYQWPLLGSQLGAPEIIFAATLFFWLLDSLACRRRVVRPDYLSLALALYAWVVALSLLAAASLLDGLAEVIKWTEVWLLYLVARALLTPTWRTLLVVSVLVAGLLQALLGIYQFLFRVGPEAFRVGPFLRAYGAFAQPNPYAGYLGLVVPLALSLTLWAVEAWWRQRAIPRGVLALLLVNTTLVLVAGLVASWSRGALLGFVLSFVFVITMRSRKALMAILLLATVLLFSLSTGIGGDVTDPVLSRFTDSLAYLGTDLRTVAITNENFAVVERAAHWLAGIAMFAEHPWLGVGAGNYPIAYARYALPRWPDPLGHAHNIYINIAAESGIIGLLTYFLLLLMMFTMAWQVYRKQDGYAKALALGAIGVLIHLSVHSIFDNLFVQRLYLHLALVLAMLGVRTNHQEHTHP